MSPIDFLAVDDTYVLSQTCDVEKAVVSLKDFVSKVCRGFYSDLDASLNTIMGKINDSLRKGRYGKLTLTRGVNGIASIREFIFPRYTSLLRVERENDQFFLVFSLYVKSTSVLSCDDSRKEYRLPCSADERISLTNISDDTKRLLKPVTLDNFIEMYTDKKCLTLVANMSSESLTEFPGLDETIKADHTSNMTMPSREDAERHLCNK